MGEAVDTTQTLVREALRLASESEPVRVASLGMEEHLGELPDYSESARRARFCREDVLADRLDRSAPPSDPDDACDLACATAYVRGRRAIRAWQPWARNPGYHLTPPLTALHLLHTTARGTGAETAAHAHQILNRLPDLLATARTTLRADLAHGPIVAHAAAQVRAGVALVNQVGHTLAAVQGGASAADLAARELTGFERFLIRLAGRADGTFRLGAPAFAALITGRDGVETSLDALVRNAECELRSCHDELVTLLGPHWRAAIAALSRDHPDSETNMLRRYADLTSRARAFCIENGIVATDDDERCEVLAAPPFRRAALAVASYYPPPVLAARTRRQLVGLFNVPFTQEGVGTEDVMRRLRSNSVYGLATRTVHETYPGHHWHFSRMRLDGVRAIRILTGSSVYVEGWATYAEQVMDEAGFFSTEERAGYLEARAFRCARVLVDVGLHTAEMSDEHATHILTGAGNQHSEVAAKELIRYKTTPTNASSYLVGALSLAGMRRDFPAHIAGNASLRHELMATLGAPPISAARQRIASLGRQL